MVNSLKLRPTEDFIFQNECVSPKDVIAKYVELVTRERWEKIQRVSMNRSPWLIPVLENPYDYGNVSAVLRTAEALGCHEVSVISESGQFKESKRVSRGADKWLAVEVSENVESSLKALKSRGFELWVADLEGAENISSVSVDSPIAILFGNEKDGVSSKARQLSDRTIQYPMKGFVESLNISVAAALVLAETLRKFQKNGWALKEGCSFSVWLQAQYLLKTLKGPLVGPWESGRIFYN